MQRWNTAIILGSFSRSNLRSSYFHVKKGERYNCLERAWASRSVRKEHMQGKATCNSVEVIPYDITCIIVGYYAREQIVF